MFSRIGNGFHKILITVILSCSYIITNPAHAANKYWIASVTANWNSSANWSLSSGGAGGAGVPGAADVANFDGNGSGNCNLNSPVNIAGINVAAAYTGTITQGAALSITVGTSNAVFAGGTFTGSNAAITFNGTSLSFSGTSFTSTSATLTSKGTVSLTGGSFNHNNGTVSLSTNTFSVTGNFTFYNLQLPGNYNTVTLTGTNMVQNALLFNSAGGIVTADLGNLTVKGTSTFSGANAVIFKTGTLYAEGDISVSFTGDPYSTGNGVISISGTGNQLLSSSTTAGNGILSNITINKSSGVLTLSGNINLFGTWNYVTGTVDASTNASTVVFAEGNCILDGQGTSATMSFYNVQIGCPTHGLGVTLAGNLTMANNLTLYDPGVSTTTLFSTTNGYTITIGGNISCHTNATFDQGNSTVILNGTTAVQTVQLGSTTFGGASNSFYNLTVNNSSGGMKLLANNLIVCNNLNLMNGLINLNGLTITIGTASATGSLSQSGGWAYGGTFTRWFSATALAVPSSAGLFPVGWSGDYCPFWLGYTSNLTTAGTVSVTFNYVIDNMNPFTPFNDATWAGGTTVVAASNSTWTLSSANSFTPNGSTVKIRYGGGTTSFGVNVLTDVNSCLASSVVATFSAATNTTVATEANRTGLSVAQLANTFRLGTRKNSAGGAPLPVELVDFTAYVNENKVSLEWATIAEANNGFFTIEKSQDGKSFVKLADVPGSAESHAYIQYTETDYRPYQGLSYYRLKQTDINGVYKYLGTVAVDFKTQQDIAVYPNPLNACEDLQFNISGNKDQQVLVVLSDMNGKEIYTKVLLPADQNCVFLLDETCFLPAGSYIVKATSRDKIYNCKLIVK